MYFQIKLLSTMALYKIEVGPRIQYYEIYNSLQIFTDEPKFGKNVGCAFKMDNSSGHFELSPIIVQVYLILSCRQLNSHFSN